MRLRFWHRTPIATAREERDAWLAWMELGGARPATTKGYRSTTEKLIRRSPELRLDEFTDDHILGVIEDVGPRSRQSRRSAFASWFGWAYRTKRIPRDPMHHTTIYDVRRRMEALP